MRFETRVARYSWREPSLWQAVSGAVDLDTTPRVGYGYDVGKGGRLTAMTYPNGGTIGYSYASGLDDKLSRVSAMWQKSVVFNPLTETAITPKIDHERITKDIMKGNFKPEETFGEYLRRTQGVRLDEP